MRNIVKYALLAILFAGVLSSCINDYGTCPQGGGNYSLRIKVLVPNGLGTRAGSHASAKGTEDENHIDLDGKDFHVIVFDNSGSQIFEMSTMDYTEVDSDTDGKSYILEAPINPDIDLKRLDSFQVMVLANWQSFDTASKYGNFLGTSIEGSDGNIYKNDTDYNFTMPAGQDGASWTCSKDEKRLIPMFGVSGTLSIEDAAKRSGTDGSTLTTEISMLRSIAKVEIVDALGDVGPITEITLTRQAKYGRFIPDIANVENNGAWNTTQLNAPSLPKVYTRATAAPISDYMQNVALVKADYTIKYGEGQDQKDCDVWVCYIPEMYLSSDDSGLTRPAFNLKANGSDYSFTFDNYYEGSVNENNKLKYVVRNHIYRYNVTGVGISAEVNLDVLPWTMNLEYENGNELYYDDPAIADGGWLKWDTAEHNPDAEEAEEGGSEAGGEGDEGDEVDPAAPKIPKMLSNGYIDFDYNYDTGEYYEPSIGTLRLKMKSGAFSDNEYVEGTFTLAAPKNAKWYATLVQIDYKRTPSFSFVDVNDAGEITNIEKKTDSEGNESVELIVKSEISGKIDGSTPQVLRIANCAQSVTDSNNEARLVIMVEMPSGQRVEATVVREKSNARMNYIIFQERTDL